MAERCIPTNLLFAKVSHFLKGDAPAVLGYLSLCGESMSGYGATTTDFTTEPTRVAATVSVVTTAVTDDTVQVVKTSWTPGAGTWYGGGVFTGASDATLQAFHEWAAGVLFEASDTVDQTIKVQSKLGT